MEAHIICMNDSIQFVVLKDKEEAEKVLERLAKSYYRINKRNMVSDIKNYEDFRMACHWHIHTAGVS